VVVVIISLDCFYYKNKNVEYCQIKYQTKLNLKKLNILITNNEFIARQNKIADSI